MKKLQSLKLRLYQYPTPSHHPPSLSPTFRTTKSSYKKIMIPRMSAEVGNHNVFNTFNYNNTDQNRGSRKPSPKHKNLVILKSEKERYSLGVHKNIELVYCKNKINDFEEILSHRVSTAVQANLRKSHSTLIKKPSSTHKTKECHTPPQKPFRLNKGKSSLLTLMKQFTELQKRTILINPESRQGYISLNTMMRKYSFLQDLDSFIISRLFQAIRGQQKEGEKLIELKGFILFSKLFTVRDATKGEIAGFIDSFLFKDGKREMGEIVKVMKRLGGSAQVHRKIEDSLSRFLNSGEQDFIQWCEKNKGTAILIIDVILGKRS